MLLHPRYSSHINGERFDKELLRAEGQSGNDRSALTGNTSKEPALREGLTEAFGDTEPNSQRAARQ